ncbi:DNA binding [Homalodisca vitripennis]|nr:DNA binding [Homalodisca vitripennis]
MSESSKILSTPIKLSSSNTSLIATSFKLREAMIATSTAGCNERHVSGTVLEQVNFEKKFSSLPEFKPEECQSPSAISVPSSPHVFNAQTFRKKQQPQHRSNVEEESTPEVAMSATPKSAKLVGSTFFGPDFNIEVFKGSTVDLDSLDASSPRTPKTPGSRDPDKGHRRVLEQRRQLVMQLFHEQGFFPSTQATTAFQSCHVDIFPNKTSLQLKIREVRQKLMANQSAHTPMSGNALTSPVDSTASTPGVSSLLHSVIPVSSSS